MKDLLIKLVANNKELHEAWQKYCSDLPNVQIIQGNALKEKADAIVSPANSFGFMDGGFDLQLSLSFGWDVQNNLQKIIKEIFNGELLVGQAICLNTDNENIPYLISAPTMRIPMAVTNTVNAYLAMKGILFCIKNNYIYDSKEFHTGNYKLAKNIIKSVIVPGLGTGIGKVPSDVCAQQMAQAIKEICFEEFKYPTSWTDAALRHRNLL